MTLRWLLVGLLAGALSVLIFHQGTAALLHAMDILPRSPYSTAPTAPWGIPQIVSTAFWGALWGLLLAVALERYRGAKLLLAALVFGAVLPTLVAWFVVAPLRGLPLASGFVPSRMLIGPLINGMWGLGTGIGLVLLGGPRVRRRRSTLD